MVKEREREEVEEEEEQKKEDEGSKKRKKIGQKNGVPTFICTPLSYVVIFITHEFVLGDRKSRGNKQ